MFETGRLCVKLAGRDAGKKCIIVDVIDDNYVLIDGLTRRRKCNIKHLEPLAELMKIRKGCSHEAVVEEFKKLGMEIKEKKTKEKKEKPRKQKKKKPEEKGKTEKKKDAEEKKEVKKKEKAEKTKKETEKKEKPKKTEEKQV